MMTLSSVLASEKSNSSSVRIRSVDCEKKSDTPEKPSSSSSRSYNNNNNNSNNNNNNNKNTIDERTIAAIMCGSQNIDKLSDKNRLIVVNDNKLYDLTEFACFHPGGSDILHEHRGQDISDAMKSNQFHRHSQTAYKILDKYYIGNYCDTGIDDSNQSEDQWGKEEKGKGEYHFNWNKPILGQLDQLGDKYFEWVHQPEEHHIRLFKSDICEYLSKSPWWLVPLIWVPITCLAFYYSYQNICMQTEILNLPFAENGIEINDHHLPVIYLVGILLWTLLEYIIHRWLFHLKPIHNSPMFVRMHFVLHGQHHKAPMDKSRLVFPPVPAFVFAFSIYKLLRMVFPVAITQSLFAGTVLGYLIYDLIHYYLHHGSPAFKYFKELKHYHMLHHYVHQHSGFGISSKLWDYPFGTLISSPTKIKS